VETTTQSADTRGRTALIIGGTLAAVLVLVLIVGGLVLLLSDGDDEAGGEVFLEPAASSGPDPFTTEIETDTPDPATMAVPPATPTGASGGTNAIRSESGGTTGLYGGTLDVGRCDPKQLVDFLEANPAKAQAWVDALNRDPTLRWSGGTTVSVSQISTYVSELTSIILVTDTRVTNYGFSNGKPTPRQAVLQRGTAVLVDSYGVPRTKCNCGNPLTAPAPVDKVTYTGDKWDTFDPTTIIVVQQTTVVIETYVLVDIERGGTFQRPVGSDGTEDVDIDVGGTTPPVTAPPDTVPEPTTPEPTTPVTEEPSTRTGARDYCEALQYYVDAASGLNTEDVNSAVTFLQDAVADLADLAPPEIQADWVYFRDVIVPQLITGEGFFTENPEAEAANQRLTAHASSACGINLE
jgi:hypothetical protein